MDYPIYEGHLEIRQSGGTRVLTGRFNYGSRATIRDRGRVRKESFSSRAFRFAIEQEPERRIDILVGHDFGKPIASRQSGTLKIEDGADAVTFEARLPDDPPSWVIDAERAIAAGLMTGLSPGFTVPSKTVRPDAEELVPEEGSTEGVMIRQINHAVLREFSVVTSAAYQDAMVALRSDDPRPLLRRRIWL
ncbi:MAG: HK97 family phage prohead protease [Gammaproteobacteria bacterium]|nr:HK97 family phage prohead protease [Nitrospira sp. SB0666_bin_27]MYF25506.1 HK97 family phage prohead protease [Nitrospira sp. SB0678_bin_10]MYJ52906.1 HK97 family phage prohead protease [Gammaproteobacteria bacterium]